MYNKTKYLLLLLLLIEVTLIIANIPFFDIYKLPNMIYASYDDLITAKNDNIFGKFVHIEIEDSIETSKMEKVNVNLKLFKIFTIKSLNANIKDLNVQIGGNPVGFSINSKGLIVVGNNPILTEQGLVDTLRDSELRKSDIIVSINEMEIFSQEDIDNYLNSEKYNGEEVILGIVRNEVNMEAKIVPAKDVYSKKYKLGIWVKNQTTGVGTLTYIREDNNRFGSLGHPICDSDSKSKIQAINGELYNCKIVGVNKGKKGVPGELKGLFLQGKNIQGNVDKNSDYGIFGVIKDQSQLLNKNNIAKVGGRFSAKPGKAKMLTCVSGNDIEEYDIEIIKTNYQSVSNEKSMVIRVTDKELLEKSGGIVQGMSGSPIIQDGKLIGAVTHVFVSDATKGFGIYIDWMINE